MACLRMGIGLAFWCMLISVSFAGGKGGEKRQAGFYLIAAEATTLAALPSCSRPQFPARLFRRRTANSRLYGMIISFYGMPIQ